MLRMLMWLFVIYVVWKVVNALTPKQRPKNNNKRTTAKTPVQPQAPFQDIQDAEYEDITPKSSPPPK
jgi:hypothetical protein